MYLDKAKALLAELGYVKPNHIYPCTEEEVVAYEKFLGVGLPLAYRKFFCGVGMASGISMSGYISTITGFLREISVSIHGSVCAKTAQTIRLLTTKRL